MANYNGLDLGLVEEFSTTAAPKERQINAYPGVNGLEVLDLGARGGRTTLKGVVSGSNAADLAAVKQQFRDAQTDGGAYVLVDPEGTTWGGVILVTFTPAGRSMALAGGAGLCQRYEAEFLHTGD